jgi:NADH:ubiquinone oxidoreductase subunit E
MSYHNISVCKGPNCKAWNSDRFVRELREIGNNTGCDGINVRRVNCMDACHGGVSVRVNSTRKVIKIKETEDVLTVLGIHEAVNC